MGRFLKNKKDGVDKERKEEIKKSKPILDPKLKLVFVNGSKLRRAEDILGLILGTKAAVKTEDLQRKDHYTRQLQSHQIDPESEDALPSIYELLGGLIRTPKEQKDADDLAVEMQKKGKKRMIE